MLDKPILTGQTIYLRPITVDDAENMFNSLADEESMRLTGTTQTFLFEDVLAYCKRIETAEDRVDYAIVLKDTSEYVGEVVLNEIDWENRSANFRIALASKNYFGKGYGSEATQLILAFGFDSLDLHRIELEVYDFNPRAQHVYDKVGFQKEGVRRDVLLWEGEYHSAIQMSILKPEFYLSKGSG
ncbi:MAG: GNAT family N-acetyltransferase [Anaerolineaceae bacterium]|nr:GNAT family N-acetyltransferase [Anaerolineaceae bacterium]